MSHYFSFRLKAFPLCLKKKVKQGGAICSVEPRIIKLFQLFENTILRIPENAARYKALPYAANNNRYAPCRPKPLTGD